MWRCGISTWRPAMVSRGLFGATVKSTSPSESVSFSTELPGLSNTTEPRVYDMSAAKMSTLDNGVRVVSLETGSANTSLAIGVQSGSRYEQPDEIGSSHFLRRVAFRSSGEHTKIHMARMPELLGGNLWATAGRESMLYRSQCLKDNSEEIMKLLAVTITEPQFHHWEVRDAGAAVQNDTLAAALDAEVEVMEAAHRAAFRNTLRNPLFCPSYRREHIDDAVVRKFWERTFTAPRIVVAGTGIAHDDLVAFAKAGLASLPKTNTSTEVTKFTTSGMEVRLENANTDVCAALVGDGASLGGKNVLAAGVLQHVLGSGRPIQCGSSVSRLSRAVQNFRTNTQAQAVNLNYTDGGLFGVFAQTGYQSIGKVLPAMIEEMSKCAKGINKDDFARAKAQLASRFVQQMESQESLVEDMATQVLNTGEYVSPATTVESIKKVKVSDVEKFAASVLTKKHVLVLHGNLAHAPYLDQLR